MGNVRSDELSEPEFLYSFDIRYYGVVTEFCVHRASNVK
jgi:hypothetical protein